MKKLLSFILLLCLFVPCSFILTACSEDDTNDVISLKILLNGEELTSYECNWDNIDGNEEIINKEDITILKVYEDATEVPVYVRDCSVKFNNGINDVSSLDFCESGETELTQPGTYNVTISNGGVSANFEIKINKMNRTYGDVSLKNGTDVLGYGGFDNTYTIDWNYNQFKNLSLSGICESEPYGEEKATISHYFVDKTGYDNAEDKSVYYQTYKTLCYPNFTTMPIGSYYIFAEFSETNYYNAGISTSPLCLTLNARNFSPLKTTLNVEFDTNKLISNNALIENAENVNIQYTDIEEEINALFPQFENYGITAFDKLSYYVFENKNWKKIDDTSSDIKVNAVNIGDVYYLVRYDFKNQKWLRVSTSAEVDVNYIEVVNYTQIQDFQSYKYFEIPLYCMFNSSNLSNDFYYCTNVDKMFKLNLTIQKAKINSSNANLGTFTIEELGYDVKPAIKTAIDNMMISNNNANVKYLYTYPSSLDGISVGTYSVSVHLISNPNICWNLYQNFSFAVKNKDNVNPNINVTNYFDYDRNITADFQQTIDMSVSFDYNKNEITIEFKENGTIIKTYTYLLEFTDKITSNGISENLDNSTFDYVVTGSNVTGSYDHYNISGVGTPTLTMNIYDSFNNKGTTEITFKIFNKNAIDNCSSSKPIISVNANSEDDIQLSGYTISANAGSIINFETSILCSDCGADCSNIAEITTTIEPQLIGLNYTELGNNMYKFDDVGTYYVTINAELSDGRKADSKILYINITRPIIVWLGEFDLPTYATQNSEVYLPYIEASQDAKVTVTVTAPGGAAPVAGDAKTTIKDGCIVWYFKTNEHTKGTYTVKYIATSKYGTITKEFRIIVGDNVAPTITIQNEENLRKDIYYDGVNKIEYIFNVEKSISNRKFVITVKSNDKDIYSYDLALNIKDKDDNGNENNNYSWSNLMYKLTGDNVNKIDDSKYTITGTGECTLTLTISDSYNNTTTKNLKFKVIEKSEQSEEIVKINTCKGYVVYTNNTGEFDIDNLNIIPGTNLTYTLVNKCIVDGILCVTTSIVTNSYGIIELSNYDNCAYIIVKVSNRGNGTELGYIQVKIYR